MDPVLHRRKLFRYHLPSLITWQAKHPHKRKRYKIYHWLNSRMNNQWYYGIKVKGYFRIKQLLLERVVLPAYGNLKAKQIIRIKQNTDKIKLLGLQNSRPDMFLGKFERRIDVLVYRLNFAPTMQWARSFVESGLIYVSHLNIRKFLDYKFVLTAYQKFPLLGKIKLKPFFNKYQLKPTYSRNFTKLGRHMFNMPLPVTLASYRVKLKSIVHWSVQNLRTLF